MNCSLNIKIKKLESVIRVFDHFFFVFTKIPCERDRWPPSKLFDENDLPFIEQSFDFFLFLIHLDPSTCSQAGLDGGPDQDLVWGAVGRN